MAAPYITWPSSGRAFALTQMDDDVQWDIEITSARNGQVFTSSVPGAVWAANLVVPQESVAYLAERRQLEAFLMCLRGGATRLRLWNLLTPVPLGTLRGSPTISAALSKGANSVALDNCGTGTLLRGDRIQFGAGGQRVMVTADSAPVGGNMVVPFYPASRVDVSAGTAAVWDRPTTTFYLKKPYNHHPQQRDWLPGFTIELGEAWES